MSAVKLEIEELPDVPSTPSKAKKRWRLASIAIRFLTTRFSNFAEPPHVSISIPPENYPRFRVDQKTLSDPSRNTGLNLLLKLGGVESLAASLQTNLNWGINGDADDVARRRKAFGSNMYDKLPAPSKSFCHSVVKAFKDLTVLILLFCAILSLVFGIKNRGLKEGWYEGGSMLFALFTVITASAISNFWQNKRSGILFPFKDDDVQIKVIRGNRLQKISISDIVVGDVVSLEEGDQIPADGLSIKKWNRLPRLDLRLYLDKIFLSSGTQLEDRKDLMLVTSVGMNTVWAQTASQFNEDKQTPLQTRLQKLAQCIRKLGDLVLVILLVVSYFTADTTGNDENLKFHGSRNNVVNALKGIASAATIILGVVVPESLEFAFNMALGRLMRLLADLSVVLQRSACEALGSITTLCIDGSGDPFSLSQRVDGTILWIGKEEVSPALIIPDIVHLIQQGVALNIADEIRGSILNLIGHSDIEHRGLVRWACKELKMDIEEMCRDFPILFIDYNSVLRSKGVLAVEKKYEDILHVHWEGEPYKILEMCSAYYEHSGMWKVFDKGEKKIFRSIIEGMELTGHRCYALAHKQVSKEEGEYLQYNGNLRMKNLILTGLVAFREGSWISPLTLRETWLSRYGAKVAIIEQACQMVGVDVKMIVADWRFSSRNEMDLAALYDCIGSARTGALEAIEFQRCTPKERMDIVDKVSLIVSRFTPLDTSTMVECLKQKGHVVSYTSLATRQNFQSEADISISMGMGIGRMTTAKDIFILSKKFETVGTVLKLTRGAYIQIQEVIQFQLTTNIAAQVINIVAAISTSQIPLHTVQLLWVNLITGTLTTLALTTAPFPGKVKKRKPVHGTEPLITNIMWRTILIQAFYQIAALLTLTYKGTSIFGVTQAVNDTLIFNAFVFCQVFNEFNVRSFEKRHFLKVFHKHKLFLGIVGITILAQVVMVEFLKSFTGAERLNWRQWGACIAIAAISWPIDWVVKGIRKSDKSFGSYLKWKKDI